jgi:PRTRC genetic system protein B
MTVEFEENTRFVPEMALIFYTAYKEYDHKHYMESADIVDGELQALKPLSISTITSIRNNIDNLLQDKLDESKDEKQEPKGFKSFLERNILYHYKNVTCWAVPQHENAFHFKGKVGKLNYPNLLFKLDDRELKIHSYKGRITPKTKLYKAPFPNIYNDASLCFGNINVSNLIDDDVFTTILNIEHSFFNSGFNNMQSKNRTKVNTTELLKKLMDSNEKFPTTQLVSQGLKISNVIPK